MTFDKLNIRFRYFQLRLLWLLELGVVNVQKIIGFTKLNLIQPWRREVLVGFIIAKLFGFIQLRKSLNHRRGAVTRSNWVSFDILMQFKFSVWSSNWADKLCISDRLIIWLAGLIRGRVLANYISPLSLSRPGIQQHWRFLF